MPLHHQYHLLLHLPLKPHTAAKVAGLHCRHHHLVSLDACQPRSSVLCPKAVVGGEEPVKGSAAEGEISEGVPLLVTFEVVEDELKQLEREAAKRRNGRKEEESFCARRLLVAGAGHGGALKLSLLRWPSVLLHHGCQK